MCHFCENFNFQLEAFVFFMKAASVAKKLLVQIIVYK